MKCFSKKILCYIICGLLTFSLTSTVYYRSVHAMEWVGGALAFEEALKWLLAAIGITATAGMTDAYWESYGDDFTDYAIENGATQTEVAEWQLKACQGIIDKGSVVWDKFKAWASSLVSGNNSSIGDSVSGEDIITAFSNTIGSSFNSISGGNDLSFPFAFCAGANRNIFLFSKFPVSSGIDSYNRLMLSFSNTTYYQVYLQNGVYIFSQAFNATTFNLSSSENVILWLNGYDLVNTGTFQYSTINISGGSISDSNFDSVASNVDDLDVISSDGVDEDNPEVTVPMPGVSDSDNEVSKDAYQDIIDAINDGTITQEQGVEQIQEILKIITYDTVTDKVVPPQVDPDTGEDKTKDDVLKENKENMGFTLGGLEAVFPFCIPFDIYAFMTLLVSDPVAPEFDYPIQSVNGEVEEIHVDLTPFEPVAVVVRYVFDFLFIIGLGILTRSLIGGGGSD